MISMAEPPAAGRSTVEDFERRHPPFDPAPARFAHRTEARTRVLDIVASAVEWREGFVVITGEEGAGKTTFCLGLAQRFGSRTFMSLVPAPPPDASRFVYGLLVDFGLASSASPQRELPGLEDLRNVLERFLISLAPLRSHAVVVLDDAEGLCPSVVEEIFRLANFTENHPGLLQIVLVGTPSLVDILRQPAADLPKVHVSQADLGWRGRFPARLPASSTAAALAIGSLVAGAVVALSIHFAGATRAADRRAPAPQPVSLSREQPFPAFQTEALKRATKLSAEPNVRGLLQLQDEVHSWDSQTKFASHAAVEGLLGQLERLTDEARRRQLDEDRRLILEDSGKH